MIMSEICWNSFGKKRKDTLQDCIGAGIWLLIQMCRLMKQQFEDYNDFVELNSEDNFFLCNYFSTSIHMIMSLCMPIHKKHQIP